MITTIRMGGPHVSRPLVSPIGHGKPCQDRQNSDPTLILDLNKVFHVRSVTQGDVIRAEAKDIPRIFQILYAGEGESRKPDENSAPSMAQAAHGAGSTVGLHAGGGGAGED